MKSENGRENGSSFDNLEMENLLSKLKSEDEKNMKNLRNMRIMYIVLLVFYMLLFIVNPDPDLQLHHRLSGLCYALSFILLIFLFRRHFKAYKRIDYSLPAAETFSMAASRYKFSFSNILAALPSLLLIDAGLTLNRYHMWLQFEPSMRIIYTQVFYWGVMLISLTVGYYIWRRRQKHLRDSALGIVRELSDI